MRPAYLITGGELRDSSPVNFNGENLNISGLGLLFKKFIMVGQVQNRMEENDRKMIKILDQNNEFYFLIGQYFTGNPDKIWDLQINSYVIISATLTFKEKNSGQDRNIYAENFREINDLELQYYRLHTMKSLQDRLNIVKKLISSGAKDLSEISVLTKSNYIAEGIYYRIKENVGFDVSRYEALLESFRLSSESSTNEKILGLIKSRGEMSMDEIVKSLENSMTTKEIEDALSSLLNSGEIYETKEHKYRYIA
jgi:RPA family protein